MVRVSGTSISFSPRVKTPKRKHGARSGLLNLATIRTTKAIEQDTRDPNAPNANLGHSSIATEDPYQKSTRRTTIHWRPVVHNLFWHQQTARSFARNQQILQNGGTHRGVGTRDGPMMTSGPQNASNCWQELHSPAPLGPPVRTDTIEYSLWEPWTKTWLTKSHRTT